MYSLLQNEFEKMLSEYSSKISSFHFNETRSLNQKLEQQSAEITKLQLTCTEYTANIEQLNNTITTLQNSNKELKAQLQEKERLLEDLNSCSTESEEEEVTFESCEQETTNNKRISSQSFSYYSSTASHVHQKRRHSELPNQVAIILCKVCSHFVYFCYVAY